MSVCFLIYLFFPLHISFSPDKRFWHAWSEHMTEYKETLVEKKPALFQRCFDGLGLHLLTVHRRACACLAKC